jgi:choline kinase
MSSPAPRALILAAGMGSRLLPLTKDRPKSLCEVAGRPLLGRLFDACTAAGVTEVVVVTGYRRDAIEGWLEQEPPALEVRTVFNPDYETINNALSVLVARAELEGADFIKLDGDLVMGSAILRQLAAVAGSALCLDTAGALDAEAMKARVEGGLVKTLGKGLALGEAAGESIGAEKIAAGDSSAVFDALEQLVHRERRHDAYYEDAYQRLIDKAWRLGVVDVSEHAWCEVDDRQDLARAEEMVRRGVD